MSELDDLIHLLRKPTSDETLPRHRIAYYLERLRDSPCPEQMVNEALPVTVRECVERGMCVCGNDGRE